MFKRRGGRNGEPSDARAYYFNLNAVLAPRWVLTDDTVFVSIGRRIYSWRMEAPPELQTIESEVFHIVPRQSSLVINEEHATLKHTLKGGKAPFDWILDGSMTGISMDALSGDLAVNCNEIAKEVNRLKRKNVQPSDAAMDDLQKSSEPVLAAINRILPEKVFGYPIAVPVHFKVVDAEGFIAEMQYFVIVDLKYDSLRELQKVESSH